MTDKDKKLAEQVLIKKGFFVMTHKEGSEHVRKVFIDPVIEAMQEFAELWHTAKMQEQKAENGYVTDEDIIEWACYGYDESVGMDEITEGRIQGAKAMRNGEIKHKEG